MLKCHLELGVTVITLCVWLSQSATIQTTTATKQQHRHHAGLSVTMSATPGTYNEYVLR